MCCVIFLHFFKELLRSLGFAWMEHFELFVCLKIGPLYLVLVKLQQILATEATLQICSKYAKIMNFVDIVYLKLKNK